MKLNKYLPYIAGVLVVATFVLIFVNKECECDKPSQVEDQFYKEEIDRLKMDNLRKNALIEYYMKRIDTVIQIKKEIQYVTKEKIKYIDRASIKFNDSIIRAGISNRF